MDRMILGLAIEHDETTLRIEGSRQLAEGSRNETHDANERLGCPVSGPSVLR